MSATNTITFKTSLERSINKAAVTINMVTESGIGVLFGQNIAPSNLNAIQRQTYFGNAQNANSAGYITFDGGAQRSLKFTMRKTATPSFPSPLVSVFYLSSGSSNIQIKNCIVGNADGVTPSYASSLPQVQFNLVRTSSVSRPIRGTQTSASRLVSRSVTPSTLITLETLIR
ncbi:MAG: hypothetical protein IPH85_14320 [Ignavibacteria bacterium]|nr:hypothetical protein [Ignavibacteria bacterium]